MDEYQESLVARFFEPYLMLSAPSCHEFAVTQIASAVFSDTPDPVDVRPSPFQGSLSYTVVLSSGRKQEIVVQFRSEEQDLSGSSEANRIHGSLAPVVTFRGMYDELFVYTTPFIPGTPYIQCLLSPPDLSLPLHKAMTTLLDIADVLTRGARASNNVHESSSLMDAVKSQVSSYQFHSSNLRDDVFTCINKISPQLPLLADLPSAFAHQDLSPFNYLIDEATGRVTGVLDWDGARYQVIGSNFHFTETFFGSMTREGWTEYDDHEELETAFYARITGNLSACGFEKVTRQHLELVKALGLLGYYLKRASELQNGLTESILHAHIRQLAVMREGTLLNDS